MIIDEDNMRSTKEKDISVIVPIYNAQKTLNRCIDSVIAQTYYNIEIILIDDGSIDNSLNICKMYAKKDIRIKIFHQKNQGLVCARKKGLSLANGKFIGFVDADDWIDVDFYETLSKKIGDADFIHTSYVIENDEIKKYIEIPEKIRHDELVMTDNAKRELIMCLYTGKIMPSIWSKLYKREFLKEIYKYVPDKQQMGEDFIAFRVGIQKASKIAIQNIHKYHYSVMKNSMSHQSNAITVGAKMCLFSSVSNVLNKMGIADENIAIRCLYKLVFESVLSESSEHISKFLFCDINKIRGKKIILFGAGAVGYDFYTQMKKHEDIEIISWMDSVPENCTYSWKKIINISEICKYQYDFVIIATSKNEIAKSMQDELQRNNVSVDKIIYQKPVNLFDQIFYTTSCEYNLFCE